MTDKTKLASKIVPTGEATGFLPVRGGKAKPVTVIGTPAIRETFDEVSLQQARNTAAAPGVTQVVLNPDAHLGYGAPIGCVLTSPTHIYPGPVGVDIKCSMSLLQLDIPADVIEDKPTRRTLIDAICARTPTGPGRGQRSVPKSRLVSDALGRRVVVEGASENVCAALGIPPAWAQRCEDAFHLGHDGTRDALAARLDRLLHAGKFDNFDEKIRQLGSYGGGNHFGECESYRLKTSGRRSFVRVSSACSTVTRRFFRIAARAVSGITWRRGSFVRYKRSSSGGACLSPPAIATWCMRRWERRRRMRISTTWRSGRTSPR